MAKTFVEEEVNIDLHPRSYAGAIEDNMDGVEEITSGDLHANAVRLLYFLVRHGVCQIETADYDMLTMIYQLPDTDAASLQSFKDIISRLQVVNRETLVRLIGDEVADRGQNDYFILKILEKLCQEGARVEILLSNHGVEFVEACERFKERQNQLQPTTLIWKHNQSFRNLATLVRNQLVLADEVLSLYEKIYKPMLKLLSYNIDEDPHGITIYTHAGVGLETIRRLAQKFMVTFADDSPEALATTIEAINQKFQEAVNNNTVHLLYNHFELAKGYYGEMQAQEDNAIEYLIWNRNYSALERPALYKGYALSFVHGHDDGEPTAENIFNLESMVGKIASYHQGQYRSLTTIRPLGLDNIDFMGEAAEIFRSRSAAVMGSEGTTTPTAFGPEHDDSILSRSFGQEVLSDELKEVLITFQPINPQGPTTTPNVTPPASEVHPRLPIETQFNQKLHELFSKARELKSRKEQNASRAAFMLHRDLQNASKKYFATPSPQAYETFKALCEPLLREAHKTLDQHRGFENLLLNIAVLVLGLGVGYVAALVINHHLRGNCFSFFKTDSHILVDSIEDSIPQLTPPTL